MNLTSHTYTSWSTASTASSGSIRSCSANSSVESRVNAPLLEKIWLRAAAFMSHVSSPAPPFAPSFAVFCATRRSSRSTHLRLFW